MPLPKPDGVAVRITVAETPDLIDGYRFDMAPVKPVNSSFKYSVINVVRLRLMGKASCEQLAEGDHEDAMLIGIWGSIQLLLPLQLRSIVACFGAFSATANSVCAGPAATLLGSGPCRIITDAEASNSAHPSRALPMSGSCQRQDK